MVLLILIFCYLSQFILQEFGTLPFPRGHHSQNQNFSWAVQFVQSSQNHIFFHFPWCSISLAQSTTFTFQAGSLPTRSYAMHVFFHYPSRWWLYLKNRFWREWKTKNEATKLISLDINQMTLLRRGRGPSRQHWRLQTWVEKCRWRLKGR